jgi:hypothetical protein
MPNRPSDSDTALAPADIPATAEYERDFYTWSFEQARLIRERNWGAIDIDNVAEEIESLGREQFAKLRSALRVLLMHMLKWDHQPERRSRSWVLSIQGQRVELDDVLDGNPGLKPRIPEAISKAYRGALIEAMQETGLEKDRFPKQCPYEFEEITTREFLLP